MSDITEGLGGAVEGGLLARAVEPDAAATAAHASGACLNCGTPLEGAFCHACGQKAHIHRTIAAILHDLAHGVLHLDGKLWSTLPMLAFKPGKLTRDYIDGRRARYISPMAMFLFSVFLMFAVFQALGISTPTEFNTGDQLKAFATKSEGQLSDARAEKQKELMSLSPGTAEHELATSELADLDDAIAALKDADKIELGNSPNDNAKLTGIEQIDKGLLKKWRAHPELMLYKLQSNSYKFSWLLIPLSVPFVWLLFFWRRQYKAYDHAIFVTYSLAFMSLLFIAVSIAGMSGAIGYGAFGILALIPPIHLYKQLRGTYGLSRFSAWWRLMALSLFIWVVLILFLQVLLLLGAV